MSTQKIVSVDHDRLEKAIQEKQNTARKDCLWIYYRMQNKLLPEAHKMAEQSTPDTMMTYRIDLGFLNQRLGVMRTHCRYQDEKQICTELRALVEQHIS